MKTNRFENTIRRKLESIQPDFQEQDWAQMQQYMKVHTPPTFWQQYGSWIGYAAAASVTTVMAFLYTSQLAQNDHLVADVKNLKNQIEVIKTKTAPAGQTDTIYIVQKEPVIERRYIYRDAPSRNETLAAAQQDLSGDIIVGGQDQITDQQAATSERSFADRNVRPTDALNPGTVDVQRPGSAGKIRNDDAATGSYSNTSQLTRNSVARTLANSDINLKVLGSEFAEITEQEAWSSERAAVLARRMNYTLASRLSTRQVQKALNLPDAATQNNRNLATKPEGTQLAKAESVTKVEKTTKAENVIPKLPLKVPYRFGGGLSFERNGEAKSVVAEVIVSKKFSITTGISWLKMKPAEFFNEKIFREKNRKDFKKLHPEEVPLALNVYNIKVNPTLVQIPLTLAFRNDIRNNWAYYAGVGTNIVVKSKETISFDCKAPNNEYFFKEFEKKTNVPAINSVNFSMGIEKTFHPVVVQAEGYLFNYFSPVTPSSHTSGTGVRFKLLYQIGGKM
jgi:hypothetical protein